MGAGCDTASSAHADAAKLGGGESDGSSSSPDRAVEAGRTPPPDAAGPLPDVTPDLTAAVEVPRADVASDLAPNVAPDVSPDREPDVTVDVPAVLPPSPDVAMDLPGPDQAPDVALASDVAALVDAPAACVSGARGCMGNIARVCGPTGAWQAGTACPFACLDGTCTGECVPGAGRCNRSTPEHCSDTGDWSMDEPTCPFACVAGSCKGVCKPGAQMCEGNGIRVCGPTGEWAPASPCQYGCAGNACLICQPGSSGCVDAWTRRVCDAKGENLVNVACPNGCLVGQCSPPRCNLGAPFANPLPLPLFNLASQGVARMSTDEYQIVWEATDGIRVATRASAIDPFPNGTVIQANITVDGPAMATYHHPSFTPDATRFYVGTQTFAASPFRAIQLLTNTTLTTATFNPSGEPIEPYVLPSGVVYFMLGTSLQRAAPPSSSSFTGYTVTAPAPGLTSPSFPVVSADDLSVYYRVPSSEAGPQPGIWVSSRATTAVSFPAGVLASELNVSPDAVPSWISVDRCMMLVGRTDQATWGIVTMRRPLNPAP